jgi:hypothetical protein
MIKLSRHTVQAMLEMKQLLQDHGITISIAAPDAYARLIQASIGIDDDDIVRVRDDLIASASVNESQEMSVDRQASRPASEQVSEKPAITPPSASLSAPGVDDKTSRAPDPTTLRSSGATTAPARSESPLQRQRVDVPPLETTGQSARPDVARSSLKIVATHAQVLTCEHCRGAVTVPVDQWDRSTPLDVCCPCGAQYQVATDARKYPRKRVELPGMYMDLEDESQTGSMVVEDISLGGIRFRTTSSHSIVRDAFLHIQFTLDDRRQTCVWEQVQVRHVYGDTMGAVFLEMDIFNQGLTDYLQA